MAAANRLLWMAVFLLVVVSSTAQGTFNNSDTPAPAPAPEPVNSNEIVRAKGGAIPVFFFVPFLGILVPFFAPISKELLKYGVLYGAGLFFTLAIEHLTSDSASGFKNLNPTTTFPWPYLMVVLGYMLTWLVDIIGASVWLRRTQLEATQAALQEKGDIEKSVLNGSGRGALEHDDVSDVVKAGGVIEATITGDKTVVNHLGVPELAIPDLLLLLLAMCFHSVFEGFAVGLSSSVYDVWQNVFTIVIHKFFEGIALGSAIVSQDSQYGAYVLLSCGVLFSLMAPIGIAIGIGIDSADDPTTSQWVQWIGNGIAAGVFIFVAINHLMAKGFKRLPNDPWWLSFVKWFATGLGVMTTTLIQLRAS